MNKAGHLSRICGPKKQFPNADETTLADRKKVTAAVLDKLAEQRPTDATIVDYSKTVLKEATDFVKAKNLITVPTTPVDIVVMPEFKRGVVGMARAQSPDSANSQFFIMFADGPFLNGKYTVVGEVASGMQVVDKMKRGEPVSDPDKMLKVQVAADVK